MTQEEIEARVERAKELFKEGFNCSQSVFAACADLYGITDEKLALRLAASFGGGIGRMRLTCGAACGMFLLEGLHSGSATPHDTTGKGANYEKVQALAQRFREENGSICCAELLEGARLTMHDERLAMNPQPEERTAEYYKKRPCVEMVASAVRIYLQSLAD